ncbi:MAG: hypothetical protein RMJ43_11890 [Chloroherpetonaceae bacterium]|nr:hypothetical protein [Chthonomonadaceae bacterium]MDW8208527.1 hypothetical protein [Chloroherpetonaceae bacterium]
MKSTGIRQLSIVLAGLALVGSGASWVASGRQAPAGSRKETETRRMAELVMDNPVYDEKTRTVSGTSFVYTEGDLKVTGSRARYNNASQILIAEGNLVMEDPKYRITGDRAEVNHAKDQKIAVITGNVQIVIKPKEQPADAGNAGNADLGEARRAGGVIRCDRVETRYKREFSRLSGNLVFQQTILRNGRKIERTLTAQRAEYDGKAEKLTLFPPVKGHDTDGQRMEFDDVVYVGTKEGAETLESRRGKFLFLIEEEEDENTKPSSSEKPAR